MLDLLRTFQLVARTASFTEAARAAGLTRPAVSLQINQLEQHFGVRLFNRTTRRVELTPAGETLLIHAARVLTAADQMHAAMAGREPTGRLQIGASTLPGEFLLPAALAALQTAHSNLEARVRVGDTDEVLHWVREGQVDLGVIGRDAEGTGLVVARVATDEIVLISPPERPGPERITLRELRAIPLLMREPGSATRVTVLEALAREGVQPPDLRIVGEWGSPEALKQAVRSGMGAAFVSLASAAAGSFPISRLEGLDLRRPICACWRPDRPPSEEGHALLQALSAAQPG